MEQQVSQMNSILKRVTASGNEKAGDHLHLDFFGVGHGYTKGLETQVSLNKALEEIGFTTGEMTEAEFEAKAAQIALLNRIRLG